MEDKKEDKMENKKEKAEKRFMWLWPLFVIFALVVIALVLWNNQRQPNTTPTLDSHGCYIPANLVWCEPNQKCQYKNETCAKRDVSQEMCDSYEETAAANNITNINYKYDGKACVIVESDAKSTYKISCENEAITAEIQISARNATLETMQQAFQGCQVAAI